MTTPSLLALAALGLTMLGMAMGAVPPDASTVAPTLRGAPFACELVARDGAGAGADTGTAIEGRLTAREAVAGTYALTIRAGGAAIDQGGDFAARPGETLTLGEAMLGTADGFDARLTLTVESRETACPLRRE